MKAIIPIAGLGTRLLPFSKVIPKALLPVHNKPSLQWIVEELNEAGVEDIIIVYSKGQEMVKEYFEHSWYDEELRNREHHEHADHLENIRGLANFHFVEQLEQLGDGHAILQARELIPEDEPVVVIFGDCLYHGDNMIKKFIQHYGEHGHSIVGVQEIHPEETHKYGIVAHKEGDDYVVDAMIEKPLPEDAPSNKAIIGRYILSPGVWKHLQSMHAGSGEARLIDALQILQGEEDIHALLIDGTWLDTGTLEGLQRANDHLRKL